MINNRNEKAWRKSDILVVLYGQNSKKRKQIEQKDGALQKEFFYEIAVICIRSSYIKIQITLISYSHQVSSLIKLILNAILCKKIVSVIYYLEYF